MRGVPVYGLDRAVCLAEKVPNLTVLDLSITLIPSWESVAQITIGLTHLKTLNVG